MLTAGVGHFVCLLHSQLTWKAVGRELMLHNEGESLFLRFCICIKLFLKLPFICRNEQNGGGDGSRQQEKEYRKEGWRKRYAQGLLTFLPFRAGAKQPAEGKTMPLNDIGCVSYLTVGWITSTMWKAFRVRYCSCRKRLVPRWGWSPPICLTSLVLKTPPRMPRGLRGSGRQRGRGAGRRARSRL